ncbi:MAG: phytoene/squalene synthase family protein [Flavobacteriaceae bacterium]|nr:phytoene/squalene synthase family protein [Flavobacteriaceae bacterium]MCY4266440.1 phytoene/squalene synthase family protein [Flavobacteriaceae bacterium]MCY4298222.1 phytoene/squalene synthase family protein [Flavobacteriaceae bacterium]
MNKLYDTTCAKTSKLFIHSYSTSFSYASRVLNKSIRPHVYNLYAFVRMADEIVDTFEDHPQYELLDQFEEDLKFAIQHRISANPILHAFQQTFHQFNFEEDLVFSFIYSMRYDLEHQGCETEEKLKKYVWGSANVVGLMCLKIFTKGCQKHYEQLKDTAIALGSAFQKVNFLRDLKDDLYGRKRNYFPILHHQQLDQSTKLKIIKDIEREFQLAYPGILKLPKSAKISVYIAYQYYKRLLIKLKKSSVKKIKENRIRVSNKEKLWVVLESYLKLNFI